MATLASLNAVIVDWTDDADPRAARTGVAVEFDCPVHGASGCCRFVVDFANPIDSGSARPGAGAHNRSAGSTPSDLTLDGTITLFAAGEPSPHWSGTITNGEATAT